MRITNKHGLPGAFVEAVRNDDYDPGDSDITATGLLAPPQQRALLAAHGDDVEEDASDRVWALLGQVAHGILERAEHSAIVEERLYATFLGWKVGAKFDRLTLRQTTLQDYKVISVWELINGLRTEKEQQLNINAEIAIQNNYPIEKIEAICICRDWAKSRAKQGGDYPDRPIKRVQLPLWEQDKRVAFIEERVKLHQAETPRPCTNEDRWYKPGKFALMKKGRKSAVRLFDDEASAKAAMPDDGKHSVEERPTVYVRCLDYCAAAPFCQQWQDEQFAKTGFSKEDHV